MNDDYAQATRAHKLATSLFSKVNRLIDEEMLRWGNGTDAVYAHIAFLGLLEAETTHQLETCPLPEEAKTELRVKCALDIQKIAEGFERERHDEDR